MRMPVRRTLARSATLAAIILSLSLSLLVPRQMAHAAPTAVVSVVNARVGLLHLSGSGFAPKQQLFLSVAGATIANPNYFTRYLTVLTTLAGTFDLDFPTGEFFCGTYLRLVISDRQDVLAESAPVLGVCPVTTPSLTITGVNGGLIGISGQGFAVKETVGISVTSLLTGAITGTVTLSDSTGAFSATVPLAPFGCGESIEALARGGAGSIAASPPFFYNCLPPQAGEPAHAPPPDPPARAAGTSRVLSQRHAVRGVRLEVSNSPPVVAPGGLETLRIATGLPYAVLAVRLSALGKTLTAISVQADTHGEATVSYRVPLHSGSGRVVIVTYIVTYRAGRLQFQHTDSFKVAA